MRQIFLLILLFIVGQWLVKALRRSDASRAARSGASGQAGAGPDANAHARPGSGRGPNRKAPAQLAEPMIRCAECGVHAPASESVLVEGQPFCSHDHAKRHAARPTGRDAR
jgi:uncharacterized protein